MKALFKFAVLALLMTKGGMVTAGDGISVAQQTPGKAAVDARQMMSGKPEAPVEIRWLADGRSIGLRCGEATVIPADPAREK